MQSCMHVHTHVSAHTQTQTHSQTDEAMSEIEVNGRHSRSAPRFFMGSAPVWGVGLLLSSFNVSDWLVLLCG